MTPPTSPSTSPLDTDLPCMQCHYNLRTRLPIDNCPECNTSVAISIQWNLTHSHLQNNLRPIVLFLLFAGLAFLGQGLDYALWSFMFMFNVEAAYVPVQMAYIVLYGSMFFLASRKLAFVQRAGTQTQRMLINSSILLALLAPGLLLLKVMMDYIIVVQFSSRAPQSCYTALTLAYHMAVLSYTALILIWATSLVHLCRQFREHVFLFLIVMSFILLCIFNLLSIAASILLDGLDSPDLARVLISFLNSLNVIPGISTPDALTLLAAIIYLSFSIRLALKCRPRWPRALMPS